uniref:Iso_dh domain-containing protein n=1 Tax=Steinernema glaseri TaxID=37863 RepID=A0A1I8AJF0_9BILA
MSKTPSILHLGRVWASGLLNAPRRAQSLDRLATFATSASATKDDLFISPKSEVRRSDRAHPLMGVRVALLTRPTAGEFTAKILADFGADVTKLWDPYKSNDTMQEGREIDLETLEGQNLVRNIARKVDVLIDNLTAGRLEEIGIDPEQMMKNNSRLIFARVSGYGQTGKLGKTTCGADATYAGMSGTTNFTVENVAEMNNPGELQRKCEIKKYRKNERKKKEKVSFKESLSAIFFLIPNYNCV